MPNKEHDDFSDRKFRETLNITIINNFMDLDKGSNPEFNSMLASFFHHMQNSFKEIPHIFVSCGFASENENNISSPSSEVKQEIENNLSAAFTEWIMMWLMKVMREDRASVVHKECKSLFVSLLQFIKLHKIQNFKTYILHLMSVLEDLSAFVDRLCEVGSEVFTIKNIFHTEKPLNCMDGQELRLIDIAVSFSNPDECEKLQEKVTSILKEMFLDITQFLPVETDRLCKILCMQIELGDLKLKQVSLVALASLVDLHYLMFPPHLVHYMFNCLQAMIIFCSDMSESLPECLEELQKAVACCLDVITTNINASENKLMLNPLTLGKLLQKLTDVLDVPYFLCTCQDFQSSIIRSIISLMKHGLKNDYPFPATSLKTFTQTALQVFIKATHPQIMVPLLVFILNSEIKKLFPNGLIVTEPVDRPQEDFIPFENMKNVSAVWCQLYDFLLKMLCVDKSLIKDINMTVVHACLEILLQTYCGAVNRNKIESLVPVQSIRVTWCDSERLFPAQIADSINCYSKYLFEVQFSAGHFDKILNVFELFLSIQDLSPLVSRQLSIICNIASIPWLQYLKTDVFDFWCEFISPKLSKNCENLISSSNFINSLKVLAHLPPNISPKWRYQVLHTSLQNVDDKIKVAAVEILPYFAYSSVLVESNAFNIVECLIKSESKEVLVAVSKTLGKLFCTFGNSCALFRNRLTDGVLQLFPKILCLQCEHIKTKSNKMEIDCPDEVNCLKSLLMHVLQHPSEMVRRDSVPNIPFYFKHNKMSEDVLASVIQLLSDPDPIVRTKFSKIICHVLESFREANSLDFVLKLEEILIVNLKSALFSSKCSGNLHFQKTVISSIGEIGKVADNGLLLITVISLLESYMVSVPSVKVAAFTKLKEIAESKQLKMQDLFKTYKDPICKFIAESLLTNSLQNAPEVLIILEEIRTIFAYVDLKTFVNQNQRYILPYLVSKEADHSDVLLSALSTVLHTNRSDLLINNFPFIFSHFVRHCSKGELEKALIFIQKETNLDLGSLLRCNYQLIHNELLLHLSTHYEQVFSGLSILAIKSGNFESADGVITHSADMANYLQPKLLGFLVFFDTQMLKSALEDKKLALESLVSIMKLMGRRAITAVRFKLMATLRIALRFRDGNFPLICCKAWDTFVRSIDITYLGPLLNQIIVALLPLLEYEPKAASEVFHFLIIENRPYLCDYFHDLYFVPDIPELQEINAVLKDYIENPTNITDFYTLLCHSLKGISHENLEVRLHALEKLKQVLQANQMAINEHLLGRENVDNLLSHLVASLIAGCRESDSRIRLSLGECLGELGAIDLGRLNIKSANSNETSDKFYSSIDDENFAYALVQELVHSFLAADECGIQDCSACAIQEVLKFYKCSDEKGGNYLWKKFPPDIQEILAVLFHSQYKSLQRSRKKFPVPIYQSKVGSTFQEWTKNWFYSLLQKVKKENPLKLFHACSIIIKYDLNSTLFLLPHLVIYALLDSSEAEQDEICSEILAVLTHKEPSGPISDLCQLSSQTIFSVLDHLSKWLHHRQQQTLSEMNNPKAYAMKLSQDRCYLAVKNCLTKIPQILLAASSFACKAYARSLMHLEQYLKNHPDDLENNTSFIQKIYTALDEPDGVAGVAAIRKKETSLMDLILENEAIGDMQGAFACYEKAIKLYPDEVNYYCGLLKCFLGMDQPTTAVSYANGILSDKPEWNEKLNQYRIEAAWKLANWQSLESFLQGETCDSAWAVGVGNLLHLANNKDLDGFQKLVKTIRGSQMAPLSAVSMEKGSYLRGYEYLTRMHMLTDLQYSVKAIFNLYDGEDSTAPTNILFHEILPVLKLRGLLLQSSPRYQEPVYDLHRVLLKISKEKYPSMAQKFDLEISNCWLKSAKLARKSGCHQRAYSCLLEAGVVKSADLFVEKTKWLWDKGEKEQAIYCLQKGITEYFPSVHLAENLVDEQQLMLAKAKLLLAIYSEESSIVDSNSLISMYKEVVVLQPKWEASHFHLARYFDKMLNSTTESDSRAEIMVHVVRNFGASLKHGCKNVYHSLPRLLDIWFDLGTLLTPDSSSSSKRPPNSSKIMIDSLNRINCIIVQELYENVPLYIFLTAFPQLVSRICHSHPTISVHLQKLISKLLASYSQQSMWMMMAVSKSSYPTRSKRCKDIFQEAILLNPSLGKFINDATRLADKLVELSNKNVGDCSTLSLSESFPSLLKLVDERSFSHIMLPTQTQMTVTFPNGFLCNSEHDPFPFTPVYIRGFADVVEIFSSLQKPKKLIVQGSDGKLYPIMCKPKDDLRKDCRLMEFNNLVNRYLKCDPEARRRQLYIRTYAVVPLNEECGLIEWVPNLAGFRFILSKLYKLKGMFVTGREIRAIMPTKTSTFEQKLHIFKTKFLPKFPPVFHDWFIMTFPDPTTWYLARLAYARTTAVMSMVGYIVGLGDRHGENILFDSSCGDTVHVDLNCLFNKGETMECPECVPFRLTHNMVDAMGPTGYEGAFRKACEVTMRVMRSKTDALMSVLRPFVHDPLVEWSKPKNARIQQHESGEITNKQGLTHVKDIELRLNGIIKTKGKQRGLPLSIEGQVNHLIQEAVDVINLSQMYIGWAAYM